MTITGKQVLDKRTQLKLSRAEFAQRCKLTPAKIWRIETKGEFKPGEEAAILAEFWSDTDVLDVIMSDANTKIATAMSIVPLETLSAGSIIQSAGWYAPLGPVSLADPVVSDPPKPVEPIFDIANRRYVSHSEIATFQDCRRKWWLTWHRGLRPAEESKIGALAVGTRVHKALELYYPPNPKDILDPRDTIEKLITLDWSALVDQYWKDGQQVPPEVKSKFEKEAKLQRTMIEGYLEWVATDASDSLYTTEATEEYVEVDNGTWWDDRPHYLVGRIDRRVRRLSDGLIMFEDFKTAASIPALVKMLPMNTQMKHYLMLLSLRDQTLEVSGALYTILRKSMRTAAATPPFFARVEVYHNLHEQDNYGVKIHGELGRIQQVEQDLDTHPYKDHHQFVPPRPEPNCAWKCPFVSICPMFDDGSNVESMIQNHFVEGNALDYYNPTKKETE